ncbi:hypothetical protein ABZ909_43545, partial [Nocardia sp. NPDC046763]
MLAVIQKSFGGPEVLEVVETVKPELLSGEVLGIAQSPLCGNPFRGHPVDDRAEGLGVQRGPG